MDNHKKKLIDETPPMKIPDDLQSNAKIPLQVDTVLWIVLCSVTIYYTDLIHVLQTHPFTSSLSFSYALFFGFIALSIALYLIVFCTYVKGVSPDDWETYNPYVIPVATGTGLLSGLCWNIALWEVYGYKTPIITLIIFMGFVMIVSILPSWSSVERNNLRQPLNNSKWYNAHGKIE